VTTARRVDRDGRGQSIKHKSSQTGGAASKALVASRARHRAAMHDDDVMASS
jgi:hypothetical protein